MQNGHYMLFYINVQNKTKYKMNNHMIQRHGAKWVKQFFMNKQLMMNKVLVYQKTFKVCIIRQILMPHIEKD